MTTHLCEVKVRSTGKTIKWYEIEVAVPHSDHPNITDFFYTFHIREQAAGLFQIEVKHTPSLRKQLPSPEDWCVDSVVI